MRQIRNFVVVPLLGMFVIGCHPGPPACEAVHLRLDSARWVSVQDSIEVETAVEEPDPFGTYRRIELSLAVPGGRELFRAAYCACSRVDPVPPGAFGLYRIHEDGSCVPSDVVSAGIDAMRPAEAGGFTLLPESEAVNRDGILRLKWVIAVGDVLEPGRYELRGRVVPLKGGAPGWSVLAVLDTSGALPTFTGVEEPSGTASGSAEVPPALKEGLRAKNPAEALRMIPALVESGAAREQVDLERATILERLLHEESFRAGDEEYGLEDIRQVYEMLLSRPDVLRFEVPFAVDLPLDRFLYLCVVEGEGHGKPAPPGVTWALPGIDVPQAILSPDPWVVSAALFLARKNGVELDPGAILHRWESGAWDAECVQQATLYLAGLSPARLAEAAPGGEGLPERLASLKPVPEDVCRCRPLPFNASITRPSVSIWIDPDDRPITSVFRDDTMEEIGRQSLELQGGVFELPPSSIYLSLEVRWGRMYGRSRQVQPKGGRFIRLPIRLQAGI